MLRGCAGDEEVRRDGVFLPPVEFDGTGHTALRKPGAVAERSNEKRPTFAREPAQRREIEVVVVVVGDEHDVDGRQLGQLHRRRPDAFRSESPEWSGVAREDRIGEDG